MLACLLLLLIGIVVLACLCVDSDRTAYAVLKTASHVFEPEPDAVVEPPPRLYNKTTTPATAATTEAHKRPYLSPFVKKQVGARAKWRCQACKNLLDETYEIDHIRPLHRARTAGEIREHNSIANLQALCRRCHMAKSAREAQG